MTEDEGRRTKDEGRIAELMMRRVVANAAVVAMFNEAGRDGGDPRAPEALAHYRAQLAAIDRQIAEITGKPPDVVVGLQSASLTAQPQS